MGSAIVSGTRDRRNLLLQEKGITFECTRFAVHSRSIRNQECSDRQYFFYGERTLKHFRAELEPTPRTPPDF